MRCGEQSEGFVFRNVRVKVENVRCADLIFLRSAPALLQSTCSEPAGEAAIFSFVPLQGAAVASPIFAALQIFSVRGFNRSQLYSPLLTVNLCLSHHFQLLLCFTYSLSHSVLTRPHCYHALICNLNPKCWIFSFSNSTVSTQRSAVISPSTKRSSFSGLCRSRPYLFPPLQ